MCVGKLINTPGSRTEFELFTGDELAHYLSRFGGGGNDVSYFDCSSPFY